MIMKSRQPSASNRDSFGKDDAIAYLAMVLFEKMEHLDPTEDGDAGWQGQTDHRREFYRLCVISLLSEIEAVRAALC